MADLDADMATAIASGNDELVLSIARRMDRLVEPPPATVDSLAAALGYARLGLHVFALKPRSKVPHDGSHGFEDASTDPDVLRDWWDRYPGSNVAIATGHLVDVIDIDGPLGHLSLARSDWLTEDGAWDDPETPILGTVSTPRPGGKHLYVPADPKRTNRAAMFPGVDARALGGYVVVPPSSTEVGRYRWMQPLDLTAIGDAM